MKRLQIKQPAEEFVLSVEFLANLKSGESITWAQSTPELEERMAGFGDNPDDSAGVVQTTLNSDGAANISLRRGTKGNIYHIRVLASTNLNAIWEEDLILPVWDF